MDATTPRTRDWKSTYALVVISPAIATRPVAVRVSQATRLKGSCARQASRIASEIWSAILSGCPSVTDSDVNRNLSCCGNAASSCFHPWGEFQRSFLDLQDRAHFSAVISSGAHGKERPDPGRSLGLLRRYQWGDQRGTERCGT